MTNDNARDAATVAEAVRILVALPSIEREKLLFMLKGYALASMEIATTQPA